MRYRLYGKNQRIFLEGLRRYRDRGVLIRIDGKIAEESEWLKILEIQRDGSFYMGDYIVEDPIMPGAENPEEKEDAIALVRESALPYEARPAIQGATGTGEAGAAKKESTGQGSPHARVLKEIRFDRVYHR